jgi:hypothetical protein
MADHWQMYRGATVKFEIVLANEAAEPSGNTSRVVALVAQVDQSLNGDSHLTE